jgi:hypothetical protein
MIFFETPLFVQFERHVRFPVTGKSLRRWPVRAV